MKKTARKGLALLLCAALLALGMPLSASAAGRFTDVPETAWYAPAVEYCREHGMMNGTGNGKFSPQKSMTRLMFVHVLYNMTKHPDAVASGGDWWLFSDMQNVSTWWASDTAGWAYCSGIAEGIGNNCFAPERPVTREQMAQFLYRYAGATENDTNFIAGATTSYADFEQTSPGAQIAMDWAVTKGILQGDQHGRLRPKDTATRAEAAQLFSRAAPLLEKRVVRGFARPNETAEQWGLSDYPRVDGSTSTSGLVQGAFERMHSAWNHAAYPITPSRTVPSYEKLIAGDVDLILVPYASSDVLAQARAAGVELEFHKLALEALVFVTPVENTVDNITEEQVVSIYRDYAIRNWSELGGPNETLIPVCRNSNSGSQSQMDNLILKGSPIHAEIQEKYMEHTMMGLLWQVAEYYKGQGCAMGYTLYAYFKNSYPEDITEPNLKMLSYNGVMPTDESLKNGEYPLTDGYYAVLRGDTPEDAPARRLLSWYQSEDGASLIRNFGFLPVG